MKHLVIGLGEVGSAMQKILDCDGLDFKKDSTANGGVYDMIHICFPYTSNFVSSVNNYKRLYKASIIVVHSTVPLGTCDQNNWTHSPVRGVHPNLEEGIKTFVKFVGGRDYRAVAKVFEKLGINTFTTEKASTTEAIKLWDTTQYGLMILIEKQIKAFCNKNNLDFDSVYTEANETYNEGYRKLGMENVMRPVLKHMSGPIGGHCVIPNAKILAECEPGLKLVETLLEVNRILEEKSA